MKHPDPKNKFGEIVFTIAKPVETNSDDDLIRIEIKSTTNKPRALTYPMKRKDLINFIRGVDDNWRAEESSFSIYKPDLT